MQPVTVSINGRPSEDERSDWSNRYRGSDRRDSRMDNATAGGETKGGFGALIELGAQQGGRTGDNVGGNIAAPEPCGIGSVVELTPNNDASIDFRAFWRGNIARP